MMNCPSCHAPVQPGAAFCDNCGINLTQFAQASSAAARPAAAPGGMKCPGCGAENVPGSLYCDNCGAALNPPAQTPVPPVKPVQPVYQQHSIPGRLVVLASNVSLPIPAGKAEVIVGREDPVSGIFPDVDLDAYDALNQGVSRSHAKLTLQGGKVYIEDLKTANYTNLRGQRLTPGQKYPLNHGDELVLGRLRLVYFAS